MVWFIPDFKKPQVFHSKINGEITIKRRFGKKAVLTGNITQSGGEIYAMWDSVTQQLPKKGIRKCLVLGVGGGTVLEFLHELYPSATLVGVELDPVMVTIAKEHLILKNALPVDLITADAISWMKKNKKKYDVIVVDLYIKELNPLESRNSSFLLTIKRGLSPNGTILYNAHYQGEKEYQELKERLKTVFSKMDEVFSYPLNRVLRLKK